MHSKRRNLGFLLMLLPLFLQAHDPVWAKDIAPILYDHCTSCHHTGGLAPFPLITYEQAYFNRFSIAQSVRTRQMPPWPPDPSYRQFNHQRLLTEAQIHLIEEWAASTAAYGDPKDTPQAPVYNPSGEALPSATVYQIPTFTVISDQDDYRCFPMPANINTDQFISAFEIIPGNPEIVHHVLVFADTAKICYTLDAQDPGPGYTSFGGIGSTTAQLIGTWVPGNLPTFFPENMGYAIPKGANIILQVHYAPGSRGKTDQTAFRAVYTSQPLRRLVTLPLLNHVISLTNGPLAIPPNTVKTFNAQFNLPVKATFIAIAPHMHLLGKSIRVWAVPPGQRDTVPLIRINNWDFHWQGAYSFPQAVVLDAGTMFYSEAVYDNTENNPNNPSYPPKMVTVGEKTTDEMMLVYMTVTLYQPGDENLDFSGTLTPAPEPIALSVVALDVFPNPVVQPTVNLAFSLPEGENGWIDLFDQQGKWIKRIQQGIFPAGEQQINIPVANLPTGSYYFRLRTAKRYGMAPLIKL